MYIFAFCLSVALESGINLFRLSSESRGSHFRLRRASGAQDVLKPRRKQVLSCFAPGWSLFTILFPIHTQIFPRRAKHTCRAGFIHAARLVRASQLAPRCRPGKVRRKLQRPFCGQHGGCDRQLYQTSVCLPAPHALRGSTRSCDRPVSETNP